MTTEETSSEPGAFAGMNPYTVALTWLWIGALVIAGVLALMGIDAAGKSFEDTAGAAQFAGASLFGSLGVGALLVWLLVNGLRWRAAEA